MGELWRPNVAYSPEGFKVEYEGMIYELLHPHTSQMGWEPTQTPALWKVSLNQEGVQHRRQDEEKAQKLAQAANTPNAKGLLDNVPYKWVPYTGSMPRNALGISNKNGKTFYVARSAMHGGIHCGYADQKNSRCFIGYGGKEIICERFEVLVIEPNSYKWVSCPDTDNINGNPVIGGHERDGTPIYVCKCLRDGVPFFGKTSPRSDYAYYSYSEKEHETKTFEVLVYY